MLSGYPGEPICPQGPARVWLASPLVVYRVLQDNCLAVPTSHSITSTSDKPWAGGRFDGGPLLPAAGCSRAELTPGPGLRPPMPALPGAYLTSKGRGGLTGSAVASRAGCGFSQYALRCVHARPQHQGLSPLPWPGWGLFTLRQCQMLMGKPRKPVLVKRKVLPLIPSEKILPS